MFYIRILVMAQRRTNVRMAAGLADDNANTSAATVEPAHLFWFIRVVRTHISPLELNATFELTIEYDEAGLHSKWTSLYS